MREIGPVSKRGESAATSRARVMLGFLKKRMAAFGLKEGALSRKMADGTTIRVWSTFGKDFVEIGLPKGGAFFAEDWWLWARPVHLSGDDRTGFWAVPKSQRSLAAVAKAKYVQEFSRGGVRDYTDEDFVITWKCNTSDRMLVPSDYIPEADGTVDMNFCLNTKVFMGGEEIHDMKNAVLGAGIFAFEEKLFFCVVIGRTDFWGDYFCYAPPPRRVRLDEPETIAEYELYYSPISKSSIFSSYSPTFKKTSFSFRIPDFSSPEEESKFTMLRFVFSPKRDKMGAAFRSWTNQEGDTPKMILKEWIPSLNEDDEIELAISETIFADTVMAHHTTWSYSRFTGSFAWIYEYQFFQSDCTYCRANACVYEHVDCGYGYWSRYEFYDTTWNYFIEYDTEFIKEGKQHISFDYSLEGDLLIGVLEGTLKYKIEHDTTKDSSGSGFSYQRVGYLAYQDRSPDTYPQYGARHEQYESKSVILWDLHFKVMQGGNTLFTIPILEGSQDGKSGSLTARRLMFLDAREKNIHVGYVKAKIEWPQCKPKGSFSIEHKVGLTEAKTDESSDAFVFENWMGVDTYIPGEPPYLFTSFSTMDCFLEEEADYSPVFGGCGDPEGCPHNWWIMTEGSYAIEGPGAFGAEGIANWNCQSCLTNMQWYPPGNDCTSCGAVDGDFSNLGGVYIHGGLHLHHAENAGNIPVEESSSQTASTSKPTTFQINYSLNPYWGEVFFALNERGRGSAAQLKNASFVSAFYPVWETSDGIQGDWRENVVLDSHFNGVNFFAAAEKWDQKVPALAFSRDLSSLQDTGRVLENFPWTGPGRRKVKK